VIASLAGIPGVRTLAPRIHGAVTLVGHEGGVSTPVLGVEPARGEVWPVRQGHPLQDADDALLDAGLADQLGLVPGQKIRLWTPEGAAELRLAGTLLPRRSLTGAGGLLVVHLGAAQRLLNLPGRINSLRLVLANGAQVEQVRRRVASRLPAGLSAQAPGRQAELAHSTLRATEQGLAGLGVLALIMAAFVTLNTFLLNLGERRQQLAILTTLGATRWQILRLLLGEVVLLGFLGTLAGCAAGVGLALVLVRVLEQFLGVPLPPLQWRAGPFVLAGFLGPATALAAAVLPAWHASSQTPLAQLRPQSSGREESASLRIGWMGMVVLLVGLILALGGCRGWFPCRAGPWLLSPTIGLLLGGGVLAFPRILAPSLALLRPLPIGLESARAGQLLVRHPTRTGLTAGVLFVVLAAAIGFGHSLKGILRDLHDWYRQTIVADFLVRGSLPDTAFVLAAALPEALGEELARLEGVERVERISFLAGQGHGRDVLVLARTFAVQSLPLDLREGEAEPVRAGLLRGEVVLGAGLAEQLDLHRGDTFTLTTARGPVPLRIAGTAAEFAAGGSALYLEWQTARKLLDVPGVHAFLVSARPGEARRVGEALRGFCRSRQLQMLANADLRELIERSLAQVTGVIWALLALIFVVAALGIANTLLMNLDDQRRAFSVLRVLGMKGGQIGRVVVTQALLLAGLSIPPGVLAGLGLAYVISRSSAAWVGVPISFRVEATVVAGCCGLALGCALLVSLVQARRAARQALLSALSGG
jgi:putative ABC transport system permease protein